MRREVGQRVRSKNQPEITAVIKGLKMNCVIVTLPSGNQAYWADGTYVAVEQHTFVVTIEGCTKEQAKTVIAERIGYDEDYGFAYSIDQRSINVAEIRDICEDHLDYDTHWAHRILNILDGRG